MIVVYFKMNRFILPEIINLMFSNVAHSESSVEGAVVRVLCYTAIKVI